MAINCPNCKKPIVLKELVTGAMKNGAQYDTVCRACNRKEALAKRGRDAAWYRRVSAEWRLNNLEKRKTYQKEYVSKNRVFIRAYDKQNRDTLTATYVRAKLANVHKGPRGISAYDIPDELVALKRLQMLIKRQLKENTV